jgi:hypothetical protein
MTQEDSYASMAGMASGQDHIQDQDQGRNDQQQYAEHQLDACPFVGISSVIAN